MPISPIKWSNHFENLVSPYGWTGTTIGPVAASVTVNSSRPHHGIGNLVGSLPAAVAATLGFASVYIATPITGGSGTRHFMRAMNCIFSGGVPGTNTWCIGWTQAVGGTAVGFVGGGISGGTERWAIRYRNGGAFTTVYSANTITQDQPYCIEAELYQSTAGNADGLMRLFIDGHLELEQTGIDNDDRTVNYDYFGQLNSDTAAGNAITFRGDCVAISTMRIGCEKFRMNVRGVRGDKINRSNLFSTVRSGTRMGLH